MASRTEALLSTVEAAGNPPPAPKVSCDVSSVMLIPLNVQSFKLPPQMDSQFNAAMIPKPGMRREGNKVPQYLTAISATLAALCAGTTLAWTSPALPALLHPETNTTLAITPEQGSWVGSLVAVGAFFGALPAGYFSDVVGRKLAIISLAIPFIASWLLIILTSSVELLYLARFLAGLATGAISTVAPMYIGEIAESSVRGALGSFFQLMMSSGVLFAYAVGALTSYTELAVISGIIPIVFLLAFLKAPETPVYLLNKNRRLDAEKSLRLLRGVDYDIYAELNELQRELEKSSAAKASITELFAKKATQKALFISLGLMVFQQLSGINAVIFYTENIFEAAGSTLKPSIAAIIVGFVQVPVVSVSTLLVDRAGRRALLLISASVMAICLAILGYYFHLQTQGEDVSEIGWLPVTSVAIFIIVFSLGFGPIPWLMTGELFASEVKGIATGIAVAMNWVQVFIVTKTFGTLVNSFGSAYTFWLFSSVCCVGTVFTYIFVLETKGKTLEMIQIELEGKKPQRNRNKPL